MSPRLPGQKPKAAPKKVLEAGQHRWVVLASSDLGTVKECEAKGCTWRMFSRKNSNRYCSAPGRKWQHSPLPCKGTT